MIFPYIALFLTETANGVKKYAMKKCGKLTPGAFNSVCINMMRAAICLFISFFIWIISDGNTTTASGHLVIILAGIGMALDVFTFIIASSMLPLVLVASVCMIGSTVIPMLLSPYIYNGDGVSLIQWLGCGLILLSIFLFAKKETAQKKKASIFKKIGVLMLEVTGMCLTRVFNKYYNVNYIQNGLGSAEYYAFINFLTMSSVFIVMFAVFYTKERRALAASLAGSAHEAEAQGKSALRVDLPYKKVWPLVLIAASSLYVNNLLMVYAAKLPSAIYFTLMNSLSFIFTFLIDVIAFKDKVTPRKLLGVAVLLIAILLVNL